MICYWRTGIEVGAFTKRKLSEEFRLARYAEIFPSESLILALIAKNGQVQFNSSEQPLNPKSGDILLD
jgi:hypothetical protein